MLHLIFNYITVYITLVRGLEGYGTLWFYPEGISNILSLAQVKNIYHVTYDSSKGNYFVVQKWNGGARQFVDSP